MTVMDRYIECLWFIDFFIHEEKPEIALQLGMMLRTPAFIRLEMSSSDVSRVEEFILLNL